MFLNYYHFYYYLIIHGYFKKAIDNQESIHVKEKTH